MGGGRDGDVTTAADSAAFPPAGTRVLVVEDEVIVAIQLEMMLAEFGCEPLGPASSVAEALAFLAPGGERPDAALLDVGLRGETSATVAEALASAGIPFVVVTGYGDAFPDGSPLAGAPRLAKPYDAAQVREALVALLGPGRA